MKIIKQFSIMMAVVLLSFSINSCIQTSGVDQQYRTITLHVDTGNINQQNIDLTAHFGQKKGLSNKDFIKLVGLGDNIIWVGVSSSSPREDIVEIRKIKHKEGDEILNELELKGQTIVVGKVKKGKTGNVEDYILEFTVFNNGIERNGGPFTIDPKLEIGVRK